MKLSNLHPDARRERVAMSVKRASIPSRKASDRKRRHCRSIAHIRAIRYARKRRLPKWLWPIVVTLIPVSLMFEQRWISLRRSLKRPLTDVAVGTFPPEERGEFRDSGTAAGPSDTGGALRGQREAHYRPRALFTTKDVGQLVAFLIRNRGRLDNNAVRAKWSNLDRISLPLAVYLRDIEANAAWGDLETEILTAPLAPAAVSGMDPAVSPRIRKIQRLLPEWSRRGEELVLPEFAGNPSPSSAPDVDGIDGHGDKPLTP